jgi:hypothetical protein
VLASSNPSKRRQLAWLLEGLPLEPVEVATRPAEETARSFRGNAELKALAYGVEEGLAIASDGGLEVPALGDAWDPLRTRRLGQTTLRELTHELPERPSVRWREGVAIADGGVILASWEEAATQGVLKAEPWPAPTDHWVWDIFENSQVGKVWSDLTGDELDSWELTWTRLKAHVQAFFRNFSAA